MIRVLKISLITILFIFIVTYAFLEGFRMPNLWSINYYLPSFFDGFYRRSLPGTVLIFIGDYKFDYYVIAAIQFFILLALIIWIFWVFKKNSLTMLIVTAYLSSACGGFLFHEVGYIDQLLYLVLFLSLWLYDKHKNISIILFSSTMLIHELSLFVTVPLYFLYVYLQSNQLKQAILHTLPAIILFLLIYLFFQTIPVEKIHLFMDQIKLHANYAYRYDYYGVFVNEFTGTRNRLHYNINCVVPLLLLTMMSIVIGIVVYQLQKKIIIAFLVSASGLSPLLLGLFGYDLNRWFFLSFSSLTIAFIIVVLHFHITFYEIAKQKWGAVLLIGYLIYVGNMQIGYFEGAKARTVNASAVLEIKQNIGTIPKL